MKSKIINFAKQSPKILLITLLILIIGITINNKTNLLKTFNKILRQNEEDETQIDWDIIDSTENINKILITIQNRAGINKVITDGTEIYCYEKAKIALDRKINKWNNYNLKVIPITNNLVEEYNLEISPRTILEKYLEKYKNSTNQIFENFMFDKDVNIAEETENYYTLEYENKIFTVLKENLEITNEKDLDTTIITALATKEKNGSGKTITYLSGIIKSDKNIVEKSLTYPNGTQISISLNSRMKYKYEVTQVGEYIIKTKDQDGIEKTKKVFVTTALTIGESIHTPQTISYTWEQLNEIARLISLNYEEANGEDRITYDIEEVAMGSSTIGVGDVINVDSYQVRILGFNHDPLADSNAYGDGKQHTYAGISLEFLNNLGNSRMNSTSTSVGGWGACELRGVLNNTTINSLSNKDYIKTVIKKYEFSSCNDKLWLLAISEMFVVTDASAGSWVRTNENDLGQYKYYKKNNGTTPRTGDWDMYVRNATFWTRSRNLGGYSYRFAEIHPNGRACISTDGNASKYWAIFPGFCI